MSVDSRSGAAVDVLLSALPCGVLVAGAPDAPASWVANPALRSLLGLREAAEIVDLRLRDAAGTVLPPERHPLRRALSGEPAHGETLACMPGDAEPERWCRWTARPVEAPGAPRGAVVVVEDVTHLRRVEDALAHAQKMDAVGRIAGSMAHDFNNLLTAIMGFGELLLESLPSSDPGRDDAREIVRSAQRGRDLTDQLLTFSRRRSREPAVFEVNDGINETLRLLTRLVGTGVSVRTELQADSGSVRMDRTEFEQILVNLVLNARDALEEGLGEVMIRTASLRLDEPRPAEPDPVPPGAWVMLAVTDDGSGMDAEVRRRIFEPFFTTKPAGQGTGLGLATVIGIAHRLGGVVGVESRPGRGTTFRVYLPPAEAAAETSDPTHVAPSGRGTETVLLVEDQEQIRALLARQLERAGFAVLQAADGHAALELWRGDPGRIDIVVSDVVMPVVDGPTMVEEMRRTAPDLPVVFVSGYPGAADPSERDTPLPDATLLRKPFAAAELLSAVRAGLDGARG
jgi:two-component system cell cycle sensor histidine kinase/response regulator CckA